MPTLLKASSCTQVTRQVNDDINRYSQTTIQNGNFLWTNLSWLQAKLGQGKLTKTPQHFLEYKWICFENTDIYLTAYADNSGRVVRVEGEYANDDGENLFTVDLKNNGVIADSDQYQFSSSNICLNVINQIRMAIDDHSVQNPDLPWKNLSTLKQLLGQPQIESLSNHLYQWNNYSLLQKADGSTISFGTLPKGVKANSFTKVTSILGVPKSTMNENLIQYQWMCADNNRLTVLTNENGKMLKILGQSCMDSACSSFSTQFEQSDLYMKMNQQAVNQVTTQENVTLNQAIKDYNAFFKTSFTRETELNADNLPRIKKYFSQVRQCTPGTHQYGLPVLMSYVFPTSTIQGKQNNLCAVETAYNMPQVGKVTHKCQFRTGSLALFTDQEAENVAAGMVSINTSHPTPLQKTLNLECQTYVNGELQ